ncbi:MAG: hypothetical protein Aurels2KO_04870 [Aureliella sp.]
MDGMGHGDRYAFSINGGPPRPDPASRFQPDDVHAASQIVDSGTFQFAESSWKGISKRDLVIYEMHLGSFTTEGTYSAAARRLDRLVELGITAVELMPLAQAPGRWNWGYDGVNLFAPRNTYGTPEELAQFVDACHSRNLAVLLDVVYNHLGPEGNYLREFAPYFSSKYPTPWGEALDFESEDGQNVREYILQNVEHWLCDYRFDGLRLDAIHFLFDNSPTHILQDIRKLVTQLQQRTGRTLHLIGEANVFDETLLTGSDDDHDAIWCDCLMHSVYAQAKPGLQLTNRKYNGENELAEVLKHGYLYQAEDGRPRRTTEQDRMQAKHPASVYESFIVGLQTHDSVGNHPQGKRLHQLTSLDYQRAAAPLALLSPGIPQIFMGEEVAADCPFPFFVDFSDPNLQAAVEKGRAAEYPDQPDTMLPPTAPETYHASKCDDPRTHNPEMFLWYQRLLALRTAARRAGVLEHKNMHTEVHLDQQVFEVQYNQGTQFIRVTCRLSRPHAFESHPAGDTFPLSIPADATTVLCSKSSIREPGTTAELSPIHAIVVSNLNA